MGVVRVDTLMYQARLTHASFPHQSHDLAMPSLRLCQGLVYGVKLLLPPHERRESPGGGRLQAPVQTTGAQQLKHLDGLDQPLHRHGPQGGDLHQALHQVQGSRRQADRTGGRHLFHTRRQMGGLPDGGIVHV
jgi:hypothetical protein